MLENKVILATGKVVEASKLQAGDLLLGPNGTTSEVLKIFKSTEDVYKVTSRLGLPFYVTKDNFLCNTSGSIQRQAVSFFNEDTEKAYKRSELCRADYVEFPCETIVPIPAYLFGILLMNSTSGFGFVRISAKKGSYMREAIEKELLPPLNMEVSKEATEKNSNSFYVHNCRIDGRVCREKNRLIQILHPLGLDGVTVPNRFIPDCYKYGDLETRKALLAAIIDCSAYTNGPNSFTFTLASKKLADDMAFLARSVGLSVVHKEAIKGLKAYQTLAIKGEALMTLPLKNKHVVAKKNITRKTFEMKNIGKDNFVQIVASGSYLTEDFTIIR